MPSPPDASALRGHNGRAGRSLAAACDAAMKAVAVARERHRKSQDARPRRHTDSGRRLSLPWVRKPTPEQPAWLLTHHPQGEGASATFLGVIPAKERVKKSNAAFAADQQPSFPRKRESISPYRTSCWIDPRLRGDDGLALNSTRHSPFADFFTRSCAGMTA